MLCCCHRNVQVLTKGASLGFAVACYTLVKLVFIEQKLKNCFPDFTSLLVKGFSTFFVTCTFLNLINAIFFLKFNGMNKQVLDYELYEYLQRTTDSTHFFFCYRWFLLEFKRGQFYGVYIVLICGLLIIV